MDIKDITVRQFKRAAVIKAQIDHLTEQLNRLFDGFAGPRRTRKRVGMSVAARKKIGAAQKAGWAKLRKTETTTTAEKPTRKAARRTMSRAARARRSAKMKAYWAAKKKADKK